MHYLNCYSFWGKRRLVNPINVKTVEPIGPKFFVGDFDFGIDYFEFEFYFYFYFYFEYYLYHLETNYNIWSSLFNLGHDLRHIELFRHFLHNIVNYSLHLLFSKQ